MAPTTSSARRSSPTSLVAYACFGLAALAVLQLFAPPTATASVQQQQQQQQTHGVPANAAVVEADAGITPEVEAQEGGDVVAIVTGMVDIDETKLGAKLLVAGKEEKGLATAWRAVVEVAGSLAGKAAPPASDAECDWSWSQLACSPTTDCHYTYKLGDWHLGRSCRLRTPDEKAEAEARALAVANGKRAMGIGEKAVVAVRSVAGKVLGRLAASKEHTAKHVGGFLDRVQHKMTMLQPPSDEDCAFDVRGSVAQKGLVCTPGCQFAFRLGDLSPNHACRRAQSKEEL